MSVDELVFLDAVLRPLGVELKLLGPSSSAGRSGRSTELTRRRPSTISLVMPSSVKRKWRVGSSKGELMTGFSMTTCFITGTSTACARSFLSSIPYCPPAGP